MPPWNSITRVGVLKPALHVRDHTLALSFYCGENIYLFGPGGGLQLIHESLRATNKSQIMALVKQRWGLNKTNLSTASNNMLFFHFMMRHICLEGRMIILLYYFFAISRTYFTFKATKANRKSQKLTIFLIFLLILFQKPILGQDTRCFS